MTTRPPAEVGMALDDVDSQKWPEIQRLADSLQRITDGRSSTPHTDPDSIFVREVVVQGLEKVARKILFAQLKISAPVWTSLDAVEKAVSRVYSTEYFERVTYKIDRDEDGATLTVTVIEKSGKHPMFNNSCILSCSDMW